MKVINHRLDGVAFDPAKTTGQSIDPKFLVMHYTAGYTAHSAIQTFKTTEIAAHLIIDKDGTITQMVPLNKRANHAGPSKWMGVEFLNNHSIGIEFVNIGWAKLRNDGRLIDAYGKVVNEEDAKSWIEAPNARVGGGRIFWAPYSEEQIEAGVEVAKAILAAYKIRDIVSHEEIDTRGWKTDPGPAFPMNRFNALMRGSTTVSQDNPTDGMSGTVKTATLNIRGGPGPNYAVIGITKLGSQLGIVQFKDGWYQVHTALNGVAGLGWVSAQYVDVI